MTPKTQTNHREATSEHRIGYSGLYLERSGVEADVLAETLVAAPERPLSDEETAEARQFEADLLVEPISSGVFLEDTLKTPMVEATVAPLFFAEGAAATRALAALASRPRSGAVRARGAGAPLSD